MVCPITQGDHNDDDCIAMVNCLNIGYTPVVLIKYHTLNVNSNPIFTSAKEDMSSPLFVCLFVCLSVCLLATLRKNFPTDLHEIFREGWQWASEQTAKFWWRSGSGIRIRIRIATLVRRTLAEVYSVPVFQFPVCFRRLVNPVSAPQIRFHHFDALQNCADMHVPGLCALCPN